MKIIKRHHRQLRFLSQSIFMEEATSPRIVAMTMMVVGIGVGGFIAWAAVTQIDEVTSAGGAIVPNGYVQLVQHLEGGIVADIPVKEGDLVVAGQVLARVKAAGVTERLAAFNTHQLTLRLQAERLRAFINRRTPSFQNDASVPADLVDEQMTNFRAMVGALELERDIVRKQKRQKGEAIEILKARKKTIRANLKLVTEARDIKEKLFNKGLVSRLAYLDEQERLTTLRGDRLAIAAQIRQAKIERSVLENRLASVESRRFAEAYTRLEAVENEIFRNREIIAKLRNVVDRLVVSSPANGVVKGLRINTIGGVISPGQILMEIVPMDRTLLAEVRIAPRDIGHVRVDQLVRVKVSSFDFSRYGTIEGKIESLSATTFDDSEHGTYYRARIILDRDYVGGQVNQNRILPGMTVEADIITGAKTVLEYLLKPVHRSLSAALTER